VAIPWAFRGHSVAIPWPFRGHVPPRRRPRPGRSPVIFPPELSKSGQAKEDLAFTEEYIKQAPAKEGVYILLNDNKETILIKGAINIQESLLEQANTSKAKFFHYEIEPMYTKKESELIQAYLAKHGKLPSGGDELDDLY